MTGNTIRTNRDYRLLLSASSISNLGDGIAMVALPWLATLMTSDPILIAAVATAQRLPWLLFSLPAGVLTDRADRRLLMVRADIVRTALMILTVLLIAARPDLPAPDVAGPDVAGPSAILSLILIAFLFGSAEVVRDNAAQTVLPSIVAHGDLERANGWMWSAEKVCGDFIGPPLAGAMIAASITLPFGADATVYALSALLIWLIALPPSRPGGHARFMPALAEGWRWMRAHPTILRLALMLGAINAVFTGGITILVLYAQEVLGLTASEYGLLLAFGALGGIAGGVFAPVVGGWLGMRGSLITALVLFTAVNVTLAIWATAPMAAAALFVEGAAGMLWNVQTVSYRQRMIPDRLLGRVNSVYRFFGWGAMPLGALGAGALVSLLSPIMGREGALHAPYMLAGAVCAGLVLYALARLRFS